MSGAEFIQHAADICGLVCGAGFGVVPDDFVAFDEEGLAGGEADGGHAGDAEGVEDFAFWIGDEIKREFVILDEFFLGVGFIGGDTEDLDAVFGEVSKGVAEAAGLFGAAGGVGSWVEEDNGRAFCVDFFEGNGFAVLVDARDVWSGAVNFFALAAEEAEAGEGAEGD